jgi:hypothetical protein
MLRPVFVAVPAFLGDPLTENLEFLLTTSICCVKCTAAAMAQGGGMGSTTGPYVSQIASGRLRPVRQGPSVQTIYLHSRPR